MLKRFLLLTCILLVGGSVVSCSSGDLPMPLAPVVSADQAPVKARTTQIEATVIQPHSSKTVQKQTTSSQAQKSTHTLATATQAEKQPSKTSQKTTAKTAPAAEKSTPTVASTSTHDVWQWPVSGTLLPVAHTSNLGIDISTKPGADVHAARAGVVVYVGAGISDYGNLIILKHGVEYLSAYGYNAKNFVHEGQQVKAGQVIATVQGTQAKPHTLHFEIRDRGQPVNPLKYLPKHA